MIIIPINFNLTGCVLKNEYMQTQDVYNLRRGRLLVKKTIPETKYETLTFKYFFPNLLNSFKHFDFFARKDSFKTQINLKMDENLKTVFPTFLTGLRYHTVTHRDSP